MTRISNSGPFDIINSVLVGLAIATAILVLAAEILVIAIVILVLP